MLYENHCLGCHDSVAHTRSSHKARTQREVMAEVQRWAQELKLDWRTADFADVTGYVSSAFYDFPAP
jgi:hypothetical protein